MTGDQLAQQLIRSVAALDTPLGSLTPRAGPNLMIGLFGETPSCSELTCMSSEALGAHPGHVHLRISLWTTLPERRTSLVSGAQHDSQSVRVRSLVFAIPAGEGYSHSGPLLWCNDPADLASFSAAVADSGPYFRRAG